MKGLARFLALAAFLVGLWPGAVGAVDFGGIAAYPAHPTADERTSAWFVYALVPGETKIDRLVIQNNTDQENTLDLYPADSAPTTGNGFALKQRAEPMTGVGRWITLEKNSVTLAPHEKTEVPFALVLPPAGSSPEIKAGLYSGGIMIAEKHTGAEGKGIKLNLRVGVRVYVTVVPDSPVNGLPSPKNEYRAFLSVAMLAVALAVAGIIYMRFIRKRANRHRRW